MRFVFAIEHFEQMSVMPLPKDKVFLSLYVPIRPSIIHRYLC